MSSARRQHRTLRQIRPTLENLGERIAPAVYHAAFLSGVTKPVQIVHKPIITTGHVHFFSLNLMVAGSGAGRHTFPVVPDAIGPHRSNTFYHPR
jgi:hypothetical protein